MNPKPTPDIFDSDPLGQLLSDIDAEIEKNDVQFPEDHEARLKQFLEWRELDLALARKLEAIDAELARRNVPETALPRTVLQEAVESIGATKRPRSKETAFHCSSEWHLCQLGKYAVAIHNLILKVQKKKNRFCGSIPHIAEYFNAKPDTIRHQLHAMRDAGFTEELEKPVGDSVVYLGLTHKQWVAKYGEGDCCKKRKKQVGHPSPKTRVPADDADEPLPGNGSAPSPRQGVPPPEKREGPFPQKGSQVSDVVSEGITDPTSQAAGGKDTSLKPAASPETEQDIAAKMEKFFRKYTEEMGGRACPKDVRRQIEQLAVSQGDGHPLELLEEVMRLFQVRQGGIAGMKRSPWCFFLDEAPGRIATVKRDSWWRERYDAEYRRKIDEDIRRAREEHERMFRRPEQKPEEPLPEGELF